ncbi:MAG TPA: bifunctional nuclease family protein [Thermotogota bacterium]|nr:bifunctional nuclease family protein [Thermotogota bacterium]HRW93048.1 bifunctional nuclease family protein [Thermotogota bacterium]
MQKAVIKSILTDKTHNSPVVQLDLEGTGRTIFIWIGVFEAWSLAMTLEGFQLGRPLTHDLLLSILQAFGAKPTGLVIHSIKNGTFYANLLVEKEKRDITDMGSPPLEIDCRPSDGLVVAAKTGIPIYVSREVILESSMEKSAPGKEERNAEIGPEDEDKFKDFLKTFDLEQLKWYMEHKGKEDEPES